MERGDNGKFIKSALRTGEDASVTGENAYEEPVELLATPVAATSMPALPSGAGTTGAEDAPINRGCNYSPLFEVARILTLVPLGHKPRGNGTQDMFIQCHNVLLRL